MEFGLKTRSPLHGVSFTEWGSVRDSDSRTLISPSTVWALHGVPYFDPMHPCIHLLRSALHHLSAVEPGDEEETFVGSKQVTTCVM